MVRMNESVCYMPGTEEVLGVTTIHKSHVCFWHNHFIYSDFSNYRRSSVHNRLHLIHLTHCVAPGCETLGKHKKARSTETSGNFTVSGGWKAFMDGNERAIMAVLQNQLSSSDHISEPYEKLWGESRGPETSWWSSGWDLCSQRGEPEFDPGQGTKSHNDGTKSSTGHN